MRTSVIHSTRDPSARIPSRRSASVGAGSALFSRGTYAAPQSRDTGRGRDDEVDRIHRHGHPAVHAGLRAGADCAGPSRWPPAPHRRPGQLEHHDRRRPRRGHLGRRPRHLGLHTVRPGRGAACQRAHRSPDPLRSGRALHRGPTLGPWARPDPPRPPRHAAPRCRLVRGGHRLLPRPPDRLRLRREPERGPAGRGEVRHGRWRVGRQHLGRRLGGRDLDRRRRLDRGVPDPLQPDPLLGRGASRRRGASCSSGSSGGAASTHSPPSFRRRSGVGSRPTGTSRGSRTSIRGTRSNSSPTPSRAPSTSIPATIRSARTASRRSPRASTCATG